ncbi:MAG TPA: DUF4224 domain-containing protein [Methylophilus sp.]|uniref:DUF4224 domain-containing protein n=1 Tax=Methylophilus sp. TaxID=29541 RepID=UPI002D196258|nr:DUF4224 domain-containing protein [Methylophilus sp.]HSH86857.1 DUF4224 domain-containing protein [Methylophilus sp.]
MSDLTLSPDEIEEITGFTQPCKQLEALRQNGFIRSHRARDGRIVLERAHYLAVCNGQYNNGKSQTPAANLAWMKKTA